MIVAGIVAVAALAAEYDLSTLGAPDVTINNGIYQQFSPTDATGSGTFESFVRISTNNLVEKGYNTSARPVQFDENNSGSFTHDEPLSHVPLVVKNGQLYREFQADINQLDNSPSWYLTLDNLEVYLSNTANGSLSAYPFTDATGPSAELVYAMDTAGSDNVIRLNYDLNKGSGKRDLRVLIPESDFANSTTGDCSFGAATCNVNVTLFSKFGGDTFGGVQYGNNDGFEEWGVAIYTATKSGVKYNDLNHNGVRDAGEPGLQGWTIYVDINGNGQFDAGEPSAVTDATGAYHIGPIPPGTFRVREVQQPGWTCSQPATSDAFGCYYEETFGLSGDHTGNDFGNFQPPGTKSGEKFNDLNGNGVKDAGEPGLQGWTIKAYADGNGDGVPDSNTAVSTQTTDANGDYQFSLNAGKYVFCEVAQNGWTQSRPFSGQSGLPAGETVTTHCGNVTGNAANGYAATITSGGSLTDNDFGNFQQGTKSGEKFKDLNANGVKDSGEPGLSGWTIRAYVDTSGDGVLQAGETTIAKSAVTDANGNYSLSLDPGKYVVCEVAQATWHQSDPSNTKCSLLPAAQGVAPGGYAVTITSGSSEINNDFGNWQQGTKSGEKFKDLNANGVKDAGEPGLQGWEIRAYVDGNGDGTLQATETTIADSDTTDANGDYLLNLDPGKYVVCEVLQATWHQSLPSNSKCSAISGLAPGGYNITVTSGSTDPGNDFGNWQQGTKSGEKFEDMNANGVKDAGDSGLPGWTIRAYVDDNGDGTLQATETTIADSDTTDANGDYLLNLNPGKYVVCEVLQATWTQSDPSGNTKCSAISGLAPAGYNITVTSGSTDPGNDFGNWQQGTKSGEKFEDMNANGVKDAGDSGLPGWTIRAYVDDNGDGTLQATETTIADSQVTDANGDYSFSLDPGKYVVCEVQQAGWHQSLPSNDLCSAIAAGEGVADGGYAVTITSGSSETDNDFGNFQQGTKSGEKYNDLNASGTKDSGEPGLPGWTIRAYVDDNGDGTLQATETTIADSQVTDVNGDYSFSLDPGKYVVCEVQQNGWHQSDPSNDLCSAIAAGEGVADGGFAVTITSGSSETDNDFGNFQVGTKSGEKFNDLNANGVKDAGDPGLPGWTIRAYVDDNGDGTLQATETTIADSQTTDASGDYSFSLDPGKYVVCEVQQNGWHQSLPSNDLCSAIAAGEGVADGGYAVTITSGSSEVDNDFGNFQQGTKSGEKFNDLNANGVKDAGDSGLPGWTIRAYVDDNGDGTLQATETTIADSQVTDANGDYSFSLDPGKYVVCEVQQANWTQSDPSNDLCSAIAAGEGVADGGYAVTITSGSSEVDNDFGNFQQGTKSGEKFKDLNANGVKDAGDPGLPGWVIRAYVDDNGDGTLQATETTIADSQTTDANGDYSFSLDPGNYVVCEVLQSTWHQSLPSNTKCSAISGLAAGGYAVTITSGSSEVDNDFGNWQQGTKSGVKFNDLNGNGVKDAGEPGLPGWVIRAYVDTSGDGTLQATETTIAASATTDANGAYSLSLDPGQYVVCEVAQAGWQQTAPSNTKCSAITGLFAGGFAVTITSGSTETGNNFGNNVPFQGCTPGFWQGGLGVTLWNTVNDPQWTSHGGSGTNPFITTTKFDNFFTPYKGSQGSTQNKTMLQIVGTGGGPKPADKAARMLVAAYLNAAFGLPFPYTTSQLSAMWTAAVNAGTAAAFTNLFNQLAAANNLFCPIS